MTATSGAASVKYPSEKFFIMVTLANDAILLCDTLFDAFHLISIEIFQKITHIAKNMGEDKGRVPKY